MMSLGRHIICLQAFSGVIKLYLLMKMVLTRPARQILVKNVNDRVTKRRSAIGKLNDLLQEMSLDSLQLKPK